MQILCPPDRLSLVKMRDMDIAYLAGVFDGEGSVGMYRRSKFNAKHKSPIWSCHISIANTDFRLLSWLSANVPYGHARVKPRKGNRKIQWEWSIRSRKTISEFLLTVRPFLTVKADQADLLLSLLGAEEETVGRGQGVRLSPETIRQRAAAEVLLKALKRQDTSQCVH